jgi:hypothetical protein
MEEFFLFTSDELHAAVLSSSSMLQFLEIVIRLSKTLQFCMRTTLKIILRYFLQYQIYSNSKNI